MSKVKAKYRGYLTTLTGAAEEDFDEKNVDGLLISIGKRHGRDAEKAARAMIIALNGENILLLKKYKTALKEGDSLSFFPLCAGG
jgi:molybdopterin synthase sulfur carrier subunit